MKVIILGGGFAGLKLADKLDGKKDIEVLLIDRFNYHQFQPLFYQVATAGLDASNISFPLRKAFHNSRNVRIRIAEVKEIAQERKAVVTSAGEFNYDKLVIALGAETNFFGNEQIANNAWPMKSTVEALRLRHHLIQNFENALEEKDTGKISALMNIVIVGGGPTGVELAGAIAEMKKWVLPKDYPELDFSQMNIYLVEGIGKVLGVMSERSSQSALTYLQQLGVKVLLNTLVEDYDGSILTFKDGSSINASTVIWAAGIKGNVPFGVHAGQVVRGNRIKVDQYNTVIGSTDVFALGDIAYMETDEYPAGHPQVAPVAIDQASLLAKNLLAGQKGQPLQPFRYTNKGAMATIGRHRAVADIPKPELHLRGFLAWFAWMALHLMQILGVKNKVVTFINWVYSYFTYDQSLRLIFKEFNKPSKTA
jgi:NADH dehydrogenase